jgi:hypothetical protein
MTGSTNVADKVLFGAFLLIALGMAVASIGVVTPGVFLPGVAAIGLGMLAAGVGGILRIWTDDG